MSDQTFLSDIMKELRELKIHQTLMMEKQNDFFVTVKTEFQLLHEKIALISNGSTLIENIPRPKPIKSRVELDKAEKDMMTMNDEFCIEYQKLVRWNLFYLN